MYNTNFATIFTGMRKMCGEQQKNFEFKFFINTLNYI